LTRSLPQTNCCPVYAIENRSKLEKNAYLPLRQEIPYTPEKTDDAKNAGRQPSPEVMAHALNGRNSAMNVIAPIKPIA
jgi:hypothetical protein